MSVNVHKAKYLLCFDETFFLQFFQFTANGCGVLFHFGRLISIVIRHFHLSIGEKTQQNTISNVDNKHQSIGHFFGTKTVCRRFFILRTSIARFSTIDLCFQMKSTRTEPKIHNKCQKNCFTVLTQTWRTNASN